MPTKFLNNQVHNNKTVKTHILASPPLFSATGQHLAMLPLDYITGKERMEPLINL